MKTLLLITILLTVSSNTTEATVAVILKQIETLRQTAPPNTGAAR